jgi:acyl-CoA thioesterase-2
VGEERPVHSLHGYFLWPGDPTLPIIYTVDCIRDGKSFTTRRVVAIQKGRPIFSLAASFQKREEGFEHQADMPDVPPPEDLKSEVELSRLIQHRIPEPIRSKITCDRAIEVRPVSPVNPFHPDKRNPYRYNWFRSIGPVNADPSVHRYLLAYASDFGLATTALLPHAHTFFEPTMQVASLDHAIWFHRDFRIDTDWLLYAMESPTATKVRGMNRGMVFTRDGVHVATVAQESLIRYRG